ncbi:MAG TPA: nuclease-related domain-containing protein [Pseudolysinimonas sp.]|nr:nuclease-related domain-containing protein [Pseudolysinimonas sp.]
MNQGTAPDTAGWSLRTRGPAHVVSHKCLSAQRAARPRRFFGRLFGLDPLHPDAHASYRGALGELRVGRILRDLGPDWRVLHALPQGHGDADFDHLVIGPAGVFTIRTTNQFGRRIRVDGRTMFAGGQRTTDITSAELEAHAAQQSLIRATGTKIAVHPIVAVVDPAEIVRTDDIEPVAVVSARRLVEYLRGLPAVLTVEVVASIARVAEDWTTWRPLSIDSVHSDPDDDFDGLRYEVDRARERRAVWRLSAVAGVSITVFGCMSVLFS